MFEENKFIYLWELLIINIKQIYLFPLLYNNNIIMNHHCLISIWKLKSKTSKLLMYKKIIKQK